MTSWSYRWDSCWVSVQAWGQFTAALQSVCDSTALCLLQLCLRWFCLRWFYRKHFQAQLVWKPRDALISEGQSINVAKLLLCNSKKLCKPTSSYCHPVWTQTSYVKWVVGMAPFSPSCPGLAASLSFFWSTWLSLPACCCQQLWS